VSAGREEEATLTLPKSWMAIPLGDRDKTTDVVRSLVQRTVGRADEHVHLRAGLRSRMIEAISEAERANAIGFWVAIEVVPKVPLPAFAALYHPSSNVGEGTDGSPAAVMAELLPGFATATSPAPEIEECFALGDSLVYRSQRVVTPPPEDEQPQNANLIVDFWITVPGTTELRLLSFSSAAPELADSLGNLFSSIVATLRWA
jgi:hypothetical protein